MKGSPSLAALGLPSRREAECLTAGLEKLHNHLAHAQELEDGHLATATRRASSIHSILHAERVQRVLALQRAMPAPEPATSSTR